MSGRVSIKGQGAEIFFGEAAPERGNDLEPAIETSEDLDASLHDAPMPSSESKPAGQQVSQPASLPASKQDSRQAPSGRTGEAPLNVSTKRRLRELLEREHRTHNTYRYHEEELGAVRDIVYELEVRWRRRVTKNDVMRAAVLWAIEDYNERGERSLLVQLLREED